MALFEQGIYQRGLAVVDVSDNSDVADVIAVIHNTCFILISLHNTWHSNTRVKNHGKR
jgi:hypothetical protein